MLIMSFVFSQIVRFSDLGVPYPIYLFVGLLPWTLFANSLGSTIGVLMENAALIKKIYFPREILIISTLAAKLVDFFIASVIFIGMMLFFQIPFSWHMLLFFPILFVQLLFTFGLSLFLSATNLLYRDVQYLFQLVLGLWFYLTPVIYPVELFPEQYRWIFALNPMAVFINAYRQVLLGQDVFNMSSFLIGLGVSILFLIISYTIFKKLEGIIADVV